MAHNAPGNGREQVRYVSAHALGRLRERADSEVHLGDEALARALDDAVERAHQLGRSENVVDDRGEPADLVDLKGCFDDLLVRGEVFALVKANDRRGSRYREAVVTVVGDKAAEGIREQTKEARVKSEPFNPALAEKLAGVVVAEVEPDPEVVRGLPERPEVVPAEPAGEYLVLEARGAELTREAAIEKVRANPNLRLYRRVRFRVEVTLEEG